MSYIDGFVLAVPTANREKYRQFAADVAPMFTDHGAIRVVECWGEDVPDGEITSFPLAVRCREDETVVFSWIVWPSREARDKGMEKIMEDPRMQPDDVDIPFDGKRMIMGGFEVLFEA